MRKVETTELRAIEAGAQNFGIYRGSGEGAGYEGIRFNLFGFQIDFEFSSLSLKISNPGTFDLGKTFMYNIFNGFIGQINSFLGEFFETYTLK